MAYSWWAVTSIVVAWETILQQYANYVVMVLIWLSEEGIKMKINV